MLTFEPLSVPSIWVMSHFISFFPDYLAGNTVSCFRFTSLVSSKSSLATHRCSLVSAQVILLSFMHWWANSTFWTLWSLILQIVKLLLASELVEASVSVADLVPVRGFQSWHSCWSIFTVAIKNVFVHQSIFSNWLIGIRNLHQFLNQLLLGYFLRLNEILKQHVQPADVVLFGHFVHELLEILYTLILLRQIVRVSLIWILRRYAIVVLLLLKGEWQNVLAHSTLPMVLRHFLVLIEWNHLIDELLGHLVQRSQLEGCDADFDIWQLPYNWLHLIVLNAV